MFIFLVVERQQARALMPGHPPFVVPPPWRQMRVSTETRCMPY
jgi:hypothetical protein